MKFLTSTLATLMIISVATYAETATQAPKPKKTLEQKKELRISKIDARLAKIKERRSCMNFATSLEGMQSCRVEKNKNKPFKLKKGMTFEEKKAKKIARIDKRILKVEAVKTCIQNALSVEAFKACRPKRNNKK